MQQRIIFDNMEFNTPLACIISNIKSDFTSITLMDNQNDPQNCVHCGTRLHRSATSTLCKSCRFKGHKEFGNCTKCSDIGMPQSQKNNSKVTVSK